MVDPIFGIIGYFWDGELMETYPVATYDGIRKRLRVLRDTLGLPWRKIAEFEPFKGIPHGTLHGIYSGKPIPKKWHEKLNYPPPRPPRIAIRLDNPESAARSIEKHMEPEIVRKLRRLLSDG